MVAIDRISFTGDDRYTFGQIFYFVRAHYVNLCKNLSFEKWWRNVNIRVACSALFEKGMGYIWLVLFWDNNCLIARKWQEGNAVHVVLQFLEMKNKTDKKQL